jgi:hypothetical protein
MIHGSLNLLEHVIIWLMTSDAYFILYQPKETHWIEASKATLKHDIIFLITAIASLGD